MNKVSVALKISRFECSLEFISDKLGLVPTFSNLAGEKYSYLTPTGLVEKHYKYNYWEYRKVYETDEWMQVLANQFLDEVVKPNRTQLKSLATLGKLEFFVGAKLYDLANPSFHFDHASLVLISEIGADIDIDLYSFASIDQS